MKGSFKSSPVISLNWIYDLDSLPESTPWKMSWVDKGKWAFERSWDTVSGRIFKLFSESFFFFFSWLSVTFCSSSKIKLQWLRGKSEVFDVLSLCKDKAAHLTLSSAAAAAALVRKKRKKKRSVMHFKGFSSLPALAISISCNYHFTCLQGPYRWLLWNCH